MNFVGVCIAVVSHLVDGSRHDEWCLCGTGRLVRGSRVYLATCGARVDGRNVVWAHARAVDCEKSKLQIWLLHLQCE